jgi:hypothetical protein
VPYPPTPEEGESLVPQHGNGTLHMLRAGLKAWFVWDFTIERYPGMNAWVRFTDDAGLHWEVTTDMHLRKLDSRDW